MEKKACSAYIQHSLKHIVQGVENIIQNSKNLDDELQKYFKRQKEKFLTFSQKMLTTKSNQQTKFSSWSTIATLLRLNPPENYEVYINMISQFVNQIPDEYDPDILDNFSEALIDILHAMIIHNELIQVNEETKDTRVVTWWEMFLYLIDEFDAKSYKGRYSEEKLL